MTAALHPAEPPPRSFAFNGVVRLTRIGTTFILFTCVIGFAALNTGNNALYIGLTFMLGSLLLSGLASKGGLKKLEVVLGDAGEAWVGRPAPAVLRVKNHSRLWNVRDVVIVSDEMTQPVLIPLLPGGGQTEVYATLQFRRRGRVELKTVDLYTRYPFGFFTKKRRAALRGELIVFPRLLDTQSGRERFRPTTGVDATANRVGMGSEIHSFRDFAHGDSLRHVYWKKSASAGKWIIKQTDLDAARTVQVVVDPYRAPGTSDEDFEQMISEATTFLHDLLERNLDVILQMPGMTLRSKDGQGGYSMFRALALVEPATSRLQEVVEKDSVVFIAGGAR